MFCIEIPKVTSDNIAQYANEDSPNVVTLLGIVMLVRAVQEKNA